MVTEKELQLIIINYICKELIVDIYIYIFVGLVVFVFTQHSFILCS